LWGGETKKKDDRVSGKKEEDVPLKNTTRGGRRPLGGKKKKKMPWKKDLRERRSTLHAEKGIANLLAQKTA